MKRFSGMFRGKKSKSENKPLSPRPQPIRKFPKNLPGPTKPPGEEWAEDLPGRGFVSDREYSPEDIFGPAAAKYHSVTKKTAEKSKSLEELDLLFEAAENGWVEELEDFDGVDLNSFCMDPDYLGMPALHIAITEGHRHFVQAIVKGGADVNLRNTRKGGQTALMVAAMFGQDEMIRLLILLGANLDKRITSGPTQGYTALLWAVKAGEGTCVKTLVEHKADVNLRNTRKGGQTALMVAAMSGQHEMIPLLVSLGAHLDTRISSGPTQGYTALLWAAKAGTSKCVKALLELKASPNVRDGKGKTGLMLAKNGEVVYVLCSHMTFDLKESETSCRRGSVNLNTTLGDSMATALHLAAESGKFEVARALIDHGADMSKRRVHENTKTALMVAAEKGHVPVLKVLCEVPDRHAKMRKALEKKVTGKVQEAALSSEVSRIICDFAVPSKSPLVLMDETNTSSDFFHKTSTGWKTLMETPATTFGSIQSALVTAKKNRKKEAYAYLRRRLAKMHRVLKKACAKSVKDWSPVEDSALIRQEVSQGADTMVGAKAAVNAGNYHALELLFQIGADPKRMGPLLVAAVESKPVDKGLKRLNGNAELELIRTLLEFGVDGNTRNKMGRPVLHLAVHSRNAKLVQLLARHADDTNLDVGNSESALHLAARQGSPEMCRALILGRVRHGPEFAPGHPDTGCRERNDMGETPIMLAARYGNGQTIRVMAEAAREVFNVCWRAEHARSVKRRIAQERRLKLQLEALEMISPETLELQRNNADFGQLRRLNTATRFIEFGNVPFTHERFEYDDDLVPPGPAPAPNGTTLRLASPDYARPPMAPREGSSESLSPVTRLKSVFGIPHGIMEGELDSEDEKSDGSPVDQDARAREEETLRVLEEHEWEMFWATEVSLKIGNGKTALHIAAENRYVDAITALADVGHDTEVDTFGSETPLMMVAASTMPALYAVQKTRMRQIKFDKQRAQTISCLLDAMANPNTTANTPSGRWTPLAKLAASDFPSAYTIQVLLDRGADPNPRCQHQGTQERTPLMIAAWKAKLPEIKVLCEVEDRFNRCVDVIKSTREDMNSSGYIALLIAEFAMAKNSASHFLTDEHGRNARHARCPPNSQRYDARLRRTVFNEPRFCPEFDRTKPYFQKLEDYRKKGKPMVPVVTIEEGLRNVGVNPLTAEAKIRESYFIQKMVSELAGTANNDLPAALEQRRLQQQRPPPTTAAALEEVVSAYI